jgi:predicted transcriptional regulator
MKMSGEAETRINSLDVQLRSLIKSHQQLQTQFREEIDSERRADISAILQALKTQIIETRRLLSVAIPRIAKHSARGTSKAGHHQQRRCSSL